MTNTINNQNCKTNTNGFRLPSHFVKYGNNQTAQSKSFPSNNKVLTNIRSLKDAYIIELAIPGFDKEQVNITFENSKLKIIGSKSPHEEKMLRREFHLEQFEKTFFLPDNIDETSFQATLENGILKVSIPLIPSKETKTITIN